MSTKVMFLILLLVLAGFSVLAYAQDEDVRGAFLTSRPKSSGPAAKSGTNSGRPRRPPKPSPTPTPTPGPTPKPTPRPTPPNPVSQRLGLGLTLFMRDSNGSAVRTDPSRAFHKGDHVRVLIETNTDGYLYVFNTTDGGPPVMIYPDAELEEAGNFIQGHVPWEIPSSVAAEERLRWFTFDQNSGAEKLYFVFTREPLPAVPIEDELITYCRENSGKCPLEPAATAWAQIKAALDEPVKVAKSNRSGNLQTATESQAVARGIGLNRDDPEPTLIMLTASTQKDILVAALDLIHKSKM